MKEKLLTVSQFAELTNVKSQGIYSKIKSGQIIRRAEGSIDILDPVNFSYLKEKGINAKTVKIPDEGKPGRPITPRKPGAITSPADGRTSAELNKELTEKKIRKLDLENDIKLKKYLPTDFIEHFLFRHIELLHTTIERLSMTSLKDYSKKILDEGAVTSQMLNDFQNLYLKACHDTKIRVMAEIKNYNPNGGAK